LAGLLTYPVLNSFPPTSVGSGFFIENTILFISIGITAAGTVADSHGIPS